MENTMSINSVMEFILSANMIKLYALIIGIIIIRILARLLKKSLSRKMTEGSVRYRVRKMIGFISFLVIVLLTTFIFSDKLRGVSIAFGVAGAGIAFALQEVIASIAGWFAVTFAGFYKIGDRVMLGGTKGDVIDISVLRTTIMEMGEWVKGDLYSGRIVRIANSFVFKEAVFNYSSDFPFLWDEIVIPVKYGSNREMARKICLEVVNEVIGEYTRGAKRTWRDMTEKYMVEDASVEPMVTLTADENWMTMTIRYVVDFKSRRKTKDLLFSGILDRIEKSEGRVSIASSALEVQLTNIVEKSKENK